MSSKYRFNRRGKAIQEDTKSEPNKSIKCLEDCVFLVSSASKVSEFETKKAFIINHLQEIVGYEVGHYTNNKLLLM